MGGVISQAAPDEFLKHQVKVEDFYMDVHEVANEQFQEFVEETGCQTVAEKFIDWEKIKKNYHPARQNLTKNFLNRDLWSF